MRIEITEKMRAAAEKGNGVLKKNRVSGGAGKGALGAGITFLVFALFSGLPFLFSGISGGMIFLVVFGVPGLIFLIAGLVSRSRRAKTYLQFYEKETGYGEAEIRQVERELLMPQTVAIGTGKGGISCYITEQFLVSVTREACYVRKLSDMCAAFYSEEIPGVDSRIHGMVLISVQDVAREARINPFTYRQCGGYTNTVLDREACAEVAAEITKRNPAVITSQIVSDGGKQYDLLGLNNWVEDWKMILRPR